MDVKMSICIPTWEQHGKGRKFLKELIESIKKQTFKDFEIIISDHSVDEGIEDLVSGYGDDINIVYVKNANKHGNGPANTNNTLRLAKGEIIKIIFQDDLLVSDTALETIYKTFMDTGCKWLVNGCNHTENGKTFNRPMVPSWNDKILEGVNTISSPSVLSILNVDIPYFDENLVMLMDCEYYHQLYLKHGLPQILRDVLVSNRIHEHQISTMYTNDINQEISYVKNKHKE